MDSMDDIELQKPLPQCSNCNVEKIIHPVAMPQPKSLAKKIGGITKNLLFPDNPLKQFKNQTKGHQFFLGLKSVFSILDWAPKYTFTDLRADLVSGITIASLSIPQGIAYAKLAHLPPIYGLYSSFIPPLIYALLGSSRDLAIGPSAILSLVISTSLAQIWSPEDGELQKMRLAFSATFFGGLFQAVLGISRLGFIVDFISHASTVGFVSGVAVIILLQQMKEILGLKTFTTKADIISVIKALVAHPNEWNWRTIVIGVCFVSYILVVKHYSTKKKLFFWISAGAPMSSVIITTLSVYFSHADKHGVKIVGHLKSGLNPPSVKDIYFTGPMAMKTLNIGIILAAIGLMEAIAIGRTFASRKNYHIDSNKEMVSLGAVNLIGSCLSCFMSTGAVSRSAVNYSAGCRTAASNIVMACLVMITLLALLPLFHYTPVVILSAIIFAAVVGLIDPWTTYKIWKVDKVDFLSCIGAFLGVIFVSIEVGLMMAIGISLLKVMLHITRPPMTLLGQIPGTNIYQSIKQYPIVKHHEGIIIIRIDATIYFTNANYIRERILCLVEDEEEKIHKGRGLPLRYVILDLNSVLSIDTTGIHAFEDMLNNLQSKNLNLVLTNIQASVLERLQASKFVTVLGQEWIFLATEDAVHTCSILVHKEFGR